MKNIPVYKHTAAYAREHDELAAYRASNQVNVACKEAIEATIRDHYRDNRLDTAAVDQVVQQFGYDRAFHILAITVCQADWDRISDSGAKRIFRMNILRPPFHKVRSARHALWRALLLPFRSDHDLHP